MSATKSPIVHVSDEASLTRCASLMASTDPWKRLYFSEEQCYESLSRPAIDVYVVKTSAKDISGFIAVIPTGLGSEPLLEYICVGEDRRGQGLGSELIRFVEDELFPDADNLYLFVSDINPDAIRLYVRLGYLCVGALPNYNLLTQTEFLHRKSRRPKQERLRP